MLNGLSPELYERLRESLLDSGYFDSQKDPKPLFVDERLWDLRATFPDTGGNPAIRVNQAIDYLYEQFDNATEKNGLVQFLDVLSGHFDPMDELHVELKELAQELEQVINTVNNAPCPYRRLDPFLTEHAPIFFGREKFIKKLVLAVNQQTLNLVLGASGSGKSSVVMAGLVPALQEEGDNKWEVIIFRPELNPFDELASALVKVYKTNKTNETTLAQPQGLSDKTDEIKVNLVKLLQSPSDDLYNSISDNLDRQHVLIIADQFEELYTRTPEKYKKPFMDLLVHIHDHQSAPNGNSGLTIKLVLTMRVDFFEQATNYRNFADVLEGHITTITPMTRVELRRAIEKPAIGQGVKFEENLVNRILDDVSHEPAQLPLLEFALTELWDKREKQQLTNLAYQKLGGVKRAFNNHARAIMGEFKGREEAVQHIFTQLVKQQEGIPHTRQAVPQTKLHEHWDLVTELANKHLIVTSKVKQDGHDIVVAELAHESLIRYWKTLRDWLKKDREFRYWQDQLNTAMHPWQRHPNNPDTLLRGPQLEEARNKRNQYGHRLTKDEQTFIEQSLKHHERSLRDQWKQRYQKRALLTATVVTFMIIAFGIWLLGQVQARSNQAQVAILEQAIDKAAANLGPQSHVPTLLCLESLKMAEELSVDRTISDSCLPRVLPTFFTKYTVTPLMADSSPSEFAIDATGQFVALGYNNARSIAVWDITQQSPIQTVTLNLAQDFKLFQFDPLGQQLAVADTSDLVTVWNITTSITRSRQFNQVTRLDFDGTKVILGNKQGRLILWDLLSDTVIEKREEHKDNSIQTLVFSPNKQWLVSGDASATGKLVLWDVKTNWAKSRELNGLFKSYQGGVAFSGDSQQLAVVNKFGGIQLYNLANLAPPQDLPQIHQDNVITLVFHPTYPWLASYSSEDRSLIFWNIHNQTVIKKISIPTENAIRAMQFTADGKKFVALDKRGNLFTWSVDLTDWQQSACQQVRNNLSFEEWQEYWSKELVEQNYRFTCPEFITETHIWAAVYMRNEASYNEAVAAVVKFHDNPYLWGFVCDFGSYEGYQAAKLFCDKMAEQFPNEPVLRSSHALARVIFGTLDETVLSDLNQAITQFYQEDRPKCAAVREKWLKRFNDFGQQLSDKEKEELIADVYDEDCGVWMEE